MDAFRLKSETNISPRNLLMVFAELERINCNSPCYCSVLLSPEMNIKIKKKNVEWKLFCSCCCCFFLFLTLFRGDLFVIFYYMLFCMCFFSEVV